MNRLLGRRNGRRAAAPPEGTVGNAPGFGRRRRRRPERRRRGALSGPQGTPYNTDRSETFRARTTDEYNDDYNDDEHERRAGMASANVMTLTNDNWEQEVVRSDKPVLVDFYAHWCVPCRALAPTIDKLADKYAGKIKVGKLNTDDAQDVAIKYGISSIPTVMLFNGGEQPVEKVVGGGNSEAYYSKMIDRLLTK
jgi:thioredoxin 1